MIKKLLRKHVFRNPLIRSLISISYGFLIWLQLSFERLADRFSGVPGDELDYSKVTAVIKTFERGKKLSRLVKSIRRTFPSLKIIVVDDSRHPTQMTGSNIQTIHLPFDSGVSAGRQIGLDSVNTPYMINLDDDYIFSRKTRLGRAIEYLEKNSNVDLVAGEVIYLPFYKRLNYWKNSLISYSEKPLYEKGTMIDGLIVYEKCSNFFIGRTESIRRVGWDEHLKRLDHADFYTRARGKITCVFDRDIALFHDQTHFDPSYLSYRHEYSQDALVLNKKYPNQSSKMKIATTLKNLD